jgi:5-methylcytosine-specific restriction enzyme A
MAANVFSSGDSPYHAWLNSNPTGKVVNSRRRCDPTYMVLHKATCRSITAPISTMGPEPFTGRGYIKICSTDESELLTWIRQNGGTGFSNRCRICRP